MRETLTIAAALIALAACGQAPSTVHLSSMAAKPPGIGAGDLADAGTTAIGLGAGFAEANPLFAGAGDAAPILGLALKVGAKHVLIGAGVPPREADRAVQTSGWGAACANVATMAGAAPHAAVIIGLACALAYREGV